MFTTNGGANWIVEEGSSHWFNAISYYQRTKAWTCADGTVWIANLQLVGISQLGTDVPTGFKLYQNFPNPFNPSATIRFDLPKHSIGSRVTMTVYDITGKEIAKLIDKEMAAGSYQISWDAKDFGSGVYLYRLQSGEYSSTQKMVLVK